MQGSVAGLRGPRKGASVPSNPRPAAGLHTTAAGQRRQRTHLWGTALTDAVATCPRSSFEFAAVSPLQMYVGAAPSERVLVE